ncbi:CobW family GTP-binding protein [Mycolicibacterium goodii]|uniref:CobW family GTP-binding protein n=1 Tax=Mycolicibacterium goodii TaxID=134601 RepID=UPI0027E124C5|nr:GTP-binding protein [Mycolicibacterium goodii]
MRTTGSVPVLALAGYLGAGKTTLLNHLLRNSRGVRIGALVNDFGAVNIDAMLVAGQVDAMAGLTNGCICCAVDADEAGEMLGKLAAVKPRLDLIVVEASGLAEPAALARTIAMADDKRYHYAGLVLVVDAVESTRAELGNNVQVADLVVVNKADQVSDAELEAVRAKIAAINDRVPVLPTEFGRIDPELLVDPPQQIPRAAQLSLDELLWETHEHDHHDHTRFQSVAFTSVVPLDPRRFMDFLKNRPAGMYRAKGFVDFGDAGDGRKFVLQLVGGSLRFERRRWDRGEARQTSLVLIGTGIDEAAALAALQACATGEPADGQAILGVLRYTD